MDQAAITNIGVHKFTYLWTINNFLFGLVVGIHGETIKCLEPKLNLGETITSPAFTDGKNKNVSWCLKLSRKPNQSNEDFLALSLILTSRDETEVRSKYKFSIINDRGEEAFVFESLYPYKFKKGTEVFHYIIRWNSILINQNTILSDDKLKICCKLSDITQSKIQVPDCRIIDDFGTIFETKKFSDAILTVADGRDIPVHKNILAARSPVFAAMFEHEMEERKHNLVNITDIDYETLYELLKFIYTGKVENLEILASELLVAADKYALERLKILCEKQLCTNLSIENATELLKLADLHGANQLKSQAIFFIINNPKVIDTIEWKQLKETSPRLLADVYEKLITSKISLIELLLKKNLSKTK